MKIGGIIERLNLSLYSVTSLQDEPGAAGKILRIFAREKINLEYITEGSFNEGRAVLAFCVDSNDIDKVDAIIRKNFEDDQLNIKKKDFVGIIGIYGPHFREKPAIAAKFCSLLGEANINILGISSSISSISSVIDVRDMDNAKQALLTKFVLP